jgi:hypothetical protein
MDKLTRDVDFSGRARITIIHRADQAARFQRVLGKKSGARQAEGELLLISDVLCHCN